jgi:uncharacterized protein (DUF305 family)
VRGEAMTVEERVPVAETSARSHLGVVAVGIVAALVLGAVVGVLVMRPQSEPGDSSPEAGFARDMSVHHAQAVDMAFDVYATTDDPKIRVLAYDIITTQRTQIGIFSGWLQQWDLPQTTVRPPMEWANHGHGEAITSYSDMPGMASDEQMAELAALHGKAADVRFLTLMIEHHRGGVEMAEAIIPLTERPEVLNMAQAIVDSQNAEIVNMEAMLADLQD